MITYSTKASDIQRQWHVIDASDMVLGRLASRVANLLIGKHKTLYAPHLGMGDYVIVINAAKVRVTGGKMDQKLYYRHSQYPGGLKSTSLTGMLETYPTRVIQHAVWGMIPHNRLGRIMMRRLKVYPGDTHPHQSQVLKDKKASREA
ncbi:MAG: 50S ribosomal protein L13 [Chloroflexi bacterium]|nr:50S ribosomal protein L13 [Chloroflexota bacterium]